MNVLEEVNVELSLLLKKRYRHRIGHCYKNAITLFNNKEIDNFIIGYTQTNGENCFIRHAWGIKDNKIIDSTFRKDELLNTKYYKVLSINSRQEYWDAMKKTSGASMLELNPELEESFRTEIKKQFDNDVRIIVQK